MRYRIERKYLINAHTIATLKARAKALMSPDSHSADGPYVVNNLYLDDRYDSFYHAKYKGAVSRNKYRLRHYNGDLSYIRLERKHKEGYRSYKETMRISQDQYQDIHSGNMDFILTEDAPLWEKLAMIYRLRGLRPTAKYAYRREAFVYAPGDVRITFDSPLFLPGDDNFLCNKPIHNPHALSFGKEAYNEMLLEIKYTGYLPEIIRNILSGLPLQHTEMSKYCIARERGTLPHGKI